MCLYRSRFLLGDKFILLVATFMQNIVYKISLLLLAGLKDDENMGIIRDTKESFVLMIVRMPSSWKLPVPNFMIAGNLTNYLYKTVYKINLLIYNINIQVYLVQKKLI